MKSEEKSKRLDWARITFWFTLALGIYLVGGFSANRKLHPYQWFSDSYNAARELIEHQQQPRPPLLERIRYQGDGVIRHDTDRAYPGLTLIQGVFNSGVEIRLVNMSGDVVQRWQAEFLDLWPDPTHVIPQSRIPETRLHLHTHGMSLSRSGDIVFNFAELGTVMMSRDQTVIWKISRMTHHSVTRAEDGSYWIPVKRDVRDVSEDLLLPKVTKSALMTSWGWYEDMLLHVSQDGRVLKEFSVLQALFDGGYERQLENVSRIGRFDPTHLNDIEVVTEVLARKIADVRPGDLLVSIRNMHMLAIMDQDTGAIKWVQEGPWLRQHDPDITPEGNIVVFNNGHMRLAKDRVPGSNIIEFDPSTRQARILYPLDGQPSFYTYLMGTHQALPNGNRLITESIAGRVFEIDSTGDIVWEYVQPYDETHASIIESAERYAYDYFDIEEWSARRQ